MGRMGAEAIAGIVEEGGLGIETAIGWHLQSNHYPPVPTCWNPVALEAIKACNEDDPDREIGLPEGVEYRDGRTAVEAWRIVESFRLDSFIYYGEEA